ncbi:MAG: FIST C-terminal domain-containing protein [Deltaproteobacteria bacterium]|nr:FIST C-terminal domain-containing protein [Deltaproteobacteria bacterium]
MGISTGAAGPAAVEEAASAALAGAGAVDLAILFATPAYPEGAERLLAAAVDALGTSAVVGASAHGVLGAGIECESRASVSVLALACVDAEPFLISDVRGEEPQVGAEIAARIPGGPRPEDLVVALPDPRLDTAALVRGLGSALSPARVVGAGAGDPFANAPAQWLGGNVETGAVAGVALRGRRVRIGVTQACRPTTEALTVTRTQGNWVLELDGRPALDVYREAALGPLADDLQRAAAFVLAALPSDRDASLAPGSYRVRHVVGFSPEARAFALPEALERGQPIALAVREPESARADLKAMLAEFQGAQPAFGLYFNCCARGSAFFGIPGLEAAYLESALPETPIAGMFGSCELGPIGASGAELLTYTGVLALLEG